MKTFSISQFIWDWLDFIHLLLFHLYTYAEYAYKRVMPRELKSLDGEVILVTGSGRGIGREICLELAKSGAKVVCWSKSAGPNQEVVDDIKRLGGTGYAYTVDVSNRVKVEQTALSVKKEVGDVTMVINNAGLMRIIPFLDATASDIESMFQVNVMSNFWVLKQFLPSMIEKGRGHIVSMCSAAGILPTRNIVAYSATKHAVHGYMDGLRDELRCLPSKPDIKLTIAYPFYCTTGMLSDGVPHTRFPLLFPIDPPDVVAKKVVEGIRKEHEYIYTPRLVGWLAMFSWLVPSKSVAGYSDFLRLNIDPVKPPQAKLNNHTYTNGNHINGKH